MIPFWIELIPENLYERGLSLEPIGIYSIAWKRDDALAVAGCICSKDYAILGGDVLIIKNEDISYTYDNWFIDHKIKPDMSWPEIVAISLKTALKYISKYSEGRQQIYYDLVCVNEQEHQELKAKE